jgi:hypothetical protein
MLTGEDGVVVRYGEADARSRGYQWLPVQPGRAGVDGEEVAVVGHEVAVVRPQRDAEQLPPNGCGGLPRRGGVEVELSHSGLMSSCIPRTQPAASITRARAGTLICWL